MIKVLTKEGGDSCDLTEFGMDRLCDPYAKFTLNDGESEPQVFTTNIVLNSAGYTKIDEIFYSKRLRKDTLKIELEIFDSNVGNVLTDDERMLDRNMKLEELVKSYQIGTKTAQVGVINHWKPEFGRKKNVAFTRPRE